MWTSLFLAGPTRTFKIALTATAQVFSWAAFNDRHLQANWSSAENALEKQTFAAKDAIFTVEVFVPTAHAPRYCNATARLARQSRASEFG